LIIIAVNHIFRHYAFDQSAWGAGCGFGMFSTVDYHGSRFFRCYVTTESNRHAMTLPPSLDDANLKARVLPKKHNLTELATKLADALRETRSELTPNFAAQGVSLAESPGQSLHNTIPCSTKEPALNGRVEVELWRIRLDCNQQCLSAERMKSVTTDGFEDPSQ
jgi:hypothetical protein